MEIGKEQDLDTGVGHGGARRNRPYHGNKGFLGCDEGGIGGLLFSYHRRRLLTVACQIPQQRREG